MSLWAFIELEEQVGRYWHRLIGKSSSYPHYQDAAVSLDSVRTSLHVFFRSLGGTPGVTLAAGTSRLSNHRLTLQQRLGLTQESLAHVGRNTEHILLPEVLAYFPAQSLNRQLYVWLTAFFAIAETTPNALAAIPRDPLQADLAFLHTAYWISRKICSDYPGLAKNYHQLCKIISTQRPQQSQRSLPHQEQAIETVIRILLGEPCPADHLSAAFLQAIQQPQPDFSQWRAARNYQTFLPVPLWGETHAVQTATHAKPHTLDDSDGNSHEGQNRHKKRSRREAQDQSIRNDPLLLNRFEKLFSWSEMVNVNRAVQDDDENNTKDAADALEEITLSPHQQRASAKLKFDLDLAPDDVDPTILIGEHVYPEWDYRRQNYHANQCRVIFQNALEGNESWEPDLRARRHFRKIHRQFEALRPKREMLHHQLDGSELDMDALVRSQCDFLATGDGSDQIHLKIHQQTRDLAIAILVDVSLSTDSWVNNRRILDIEKEALITLATGLATCRDAFAIYTFTSRKRDYVRVTAIKNFNDPFDHRTLNRIAALRAGYYTRMGAALRHTQQLLQQRPERHRLILLLSDGKPNDLDYYEGRYGIEDTRQAIVEIRKSGLAVFGITIDRKAQDYFPYLFGKGGYAIAARPDRLSHIVPVIYRHLTG